MGETIGVGVIGMGFMGATHVRAYAGARGCELVAVADRDESRRAGKVDVAGNVGGGSSGALFDAETVAGYASAEELLGDARVDAVSICTHTDSHVDLAIAALGAGKHVLVEKPVAVRADDVRRLADAADRALDERGLVCMPAMCMRYWPGWDWLKARVEDGAYGAVRSAVFTRLASPPSWAPDFYSDSARTAGALVDLHIHDADFVRWCFGEPDTVHATGSVDHVTALYGYADGPAHVAAEGGWDHTPGFEFRMRYVVVFEQATADFDVGRDPRLLLCRDGASEAVPIDEGTGYGPEVRAFIGAITRGTLTHTVRDALATAELLERERRELPESP